MRLLLDTNILIAITPRYVKALDARIKETLQTDDNASFASVASFWEIAIKSRLGKLDLGLSLNELAGFIEAAGIILLAIDLSHVIAEPEPQPATRDPFDRLLLAQCQVENLRLVTLDRALAAHPLAWR